MGDNITRRIKELETTQVAVANSAGISQVALHKIIKGKTKNSGYISAVAKALGLTVEQLESGKWSMIEENVVPHKTEARQVPVIDMVQAGRLLSATDPFEPGYADEYMEWFIPCSDKSYSLRVMGDSMYPIYQEGGVILVDPAIRPENGDDVIVRTPDGRTTFKRLRYDMDGPYLEALNKDFPDRIIRVPEGSEFGGVVIGYFVHRRRNS